MRILAYACTLWCVLEFGVSLSAQVNGKVGDDTAASATAKRTVDALKRRADIANAVLSGETKSEMAVDQLRGEISASGFQLEADADLGLAAFDIGQRLLAAHKGADAEKFFRASEAALSLVLGRAGRSTAREKAQYLQIRAVIRANYLNMASEARADLDAALQLTPEDKNLSQLRRLIPADAATILQQHKGPPTRG